MRLSIITLVIVTTMLFSQSVVGQDNAHQISIETEPVAYILGGAGITGSYQYDNRAYSIEVFGGLIVPESLHGNKGFEALLGALNYKSNDSFPEQKDFTPDRNLGSVIWR